MKFVKSLAVATALMSASMMTPSLASAEVDSVSDYFEAMAEKTTKINDAGEPWAQSAHDTMPGGTAMDDGAGAVTRLGTGVTAVTVGPIAGFLKTLWKDLSYTAPKNR